MAKQRMKSESVKLVTPECRIAFPVLFEAKAAPGSDKKKYSVVMLFRVVADPKKADEKVVDISELKALVKAVVVEKFGENQALWPKLGDKVGELQIPWHDGNELNKSGKPKFGPGIIFATASRPGDQIRPGCVQAFAGPDGRSAPVVVPTDLYGGCYARVQVNPYFWEYMGKMGVSLGLNHIQKIRDGEPLGMGGDAADAFEPIEPPTGSVASAAAVGTVGAGL